MISMKPILKILATALFLSEFSALAPRADAQGGVPLWTNRYNGSGNGYDASYAVAVDTNGNVLVAGYSRGSGSGYDYTTLKYSGAGVPLWTNRYNGPGNGVDYAIAIAVDGSGNVYVTGNSPGSGGSDDYATIKYSISVITPIRLNYQIVAGQLELSWSNAAFGLQTGPLVQGGYTNIPGATNPFTVNRSELQRYFRLKAN